MQVKIGRYQTRLSRIVEITRSHEVDDRQPDGSIIRKQMWVGMMFKADGRTPDTEHEWEDSGAYRNQRGVASPNDLAILVQAAA